MNSQTELKWGVQQRLTFLEDHLYWQGQISRKAIMDKTGVSKAQASLDLALYKKNAPENLTYSLSDKTYYLSDNFNPFLIDISPESFLGSQPSGLAEQISLPFRSINTDHLRVLHKAIENQSWVTIEYQSLTGSPKSLRDVAPHHYVFNGRRWHIRAYDFLRSEFRDFVLGRIINAVVVTTNRPSDAHNWKLKHDTAWNEHVSLILVPHPGLTEAQRSIIEVDYSMENGCTSYQVRKAYLFYAITQLRLFDESPHPWIQQVVLKNKDEIEPFVNIS